MSRPPADWLAQITELLNERPELVGVGLAAAAEAVTA